MHKFYFNDCLPACNNQQEFINCLEKTLIEFKKLVDEDIDIDKAISTENLPFSMFLGNTYTLADTISKIGNRELRKLASSYFYMGKQHNALNLAMLHENEGFIFTVALHDDLKQHLLCLNPKKEVPDLEVDNLLRDETNSHSEVHNLFGEEGNTRIIREKIVSLNNLNLSNIENLKQVLGDFIFSSKFERDFLGLNDAEQTSIIDDFKKAKERKLLSPFYPDTKIIKDVTPDNPKCNVYELRVYTPTALRVYFNEYKGKVYVASIGFKSSTKQSEDIKKAHTTLYKMILTA